MNYIIVSMSLSKEKILLNLSPSGRLSLGDVICLDRVDSTNRWLLQQARQQNVHHHVCIAQSQTSGVGRSGKRWCGGNSGNVLMSVAHEFNLPPAKLTGLSLVAGIAIVNALESLGVRQLSLKWPNDVYLNGCKLAGILIQSHSRNEAGQCAIVGIGLNISLDTESKKAINQPVAELSRIGFNVDQRELIIARILDQLFLAFRQFSETGLDEYYLRWDQLDHLKGRFVILSRGDESISGHYLGINRQGAIRMALENNQIKEYYVGELSIRAVNKT